MDGQRSDGGQRTGGTAAGGPRAIDQATIAAIIASADLRAVARERGVELRKVGGEWIGRCPFHEDEHPSFAVVTRKGEHFYKCQPCGAHGDAIELVMRLDRVPFREAVRRLGEMVGIAVDVDGTGGLTPEQEARVAAERAARIEAANRAHRAAEARAERERRAAVAEARDWWERAERDEAAIGRWMRGRGIDPARVNGGEIPRSLRYLAACPRTVRRGKDGEPLAPGPHAGLAIMPAVLAAFVDPAGGEVGGVRGVQRIYVDETGRKAQGGDARQERGSFSGGGIVPLVPGERADGTVIVGEGVETMLAVAAGLAGTGYAGAAVYSVLSTGGYRHLELPVEAGQSEPRWCRRIVVAADWDRMGRGGSLAGLRPGEHAARQAAVEWLRRWPWVQVRIAPPWPVVMRQAGLALFEGDEAAGGRKGVDWNDVLVALGPGRAQRLGELLRECEQLPAAEADAAYTGERARVRGGGAKQAGGADEAGQESPAAEGGNGGAAGGGDGDRGTVPGDGAQDDEGPLRLGVTRDDRAKEVLARMFLPRTRGERCLALRRYAGQWWVWQALDGGLPRWVEVAEELLLARVGRLLDRYETLQRSRWRPAALSGGRVVDIMHAAIAYTAVTGDMPTWLRPQVAADGTVRWDDEVRFSQPAVAGPMPGAAVVATEDGLIDVEAWCRGEVRIVPPTPCWFGRSCAPFRLPVERLRGVDVSDDLAMGPVIAEMCPRWLEFLSATFSDSDRCIAALQEWFGYCLTPDISLQKLLWLQGLPGSGKGTIREVLTAVVGDDNVAMVPDLESLTGRFDMGSLVGRNVAIIPELRIGRHTDVAIALNRLLMISGGDPVAIEDKFSNRQPLVRLTCKFMVTPNEEPKVSDSSSALIRRLLVVPMGHPPRKPDPTLPARLKAEAQGVMLWALVGLARLRRQGEFTQPEEGAEILDEMRRRMSPVRAFVEDACVLQAGSRVRTDVFLAAYKAWMAGQGHGEVHDTAASLGSKLKAAVAGVDRQRETIREAGLTRKVAWYVGVRPLLVGEDQTTPFEAQDVDTVDHVPGLGRVDGGGLLP